MQDEQSPNRFGLTFSDFFSVFHYEIKLGFCTTKISTNPDNVP